MQDPNADTEWNDILRAKGIIPPKEEKEITENDLVQLVEETVEEKSKAKGMDEMTLEELDDEEDEVDEEEERLYQEYRSRRQVFLGRPLFLFPCGFHVRACLVMLEAGLRRVWPMHRQRL